MSLSAAILVAISLKYCIASRSPKSFVTIEPYGIPASSFEYMWMFRDFEDAVDIELFNISISDAIMHYAQTGNSSLFESIKRQEDPRDIALCIIDYLKQFGHVNDRMFTRPLFSWLGSAVSQCHLIADFLKSTEFRALLKLVTDAIQAIFDAGVKANNLILVQFLAVQFFNNFVPESQDNLALSCAFQVGNRQLVDLLLSFDSVKCSALQNENKLIIAVKIGTLADVKHIFETNEINAFGKPELFCALRTAVLINRSDIVKYLLTQKNVPRTNPSRREKKLVALAMSSGNFHCARELLKDVEIIELTSLEQIFEISCRKGDYETVKAILEISPQIPDRLDENSLCWAAEGGNLSIFRDLESTIQISSINSILIASSYNPNLEMLEYLVGDGISSVESVEKDDLDAVSDLRAACLRNNLSEMRKHLRNGGIKRLPFALLLFMVAKFPEIPRSWISGLDPETANLIFLIMLKKWGKFWDFHSGNQVVQMLGMYECLSTSTDIISMVISQAISSNRWDLIEAFARHPGFQNIHVYSWRCILHEARSCNQARIVFSMLKYKQLPLIDDYLECIFSSARKLSGSGQPLNDSDHPIQQTSILNMLVGHVGIGIVEKYLLTKGQSSYIASIPSSFFKEFPCRSELFIDLLKKSKPQIYTTKFRKLQIYTKMAQKFQNYKSIQRDVGETPELICLFNAGNL